MNEGRKALLGKAKEQLKCAETLVMQALYEEEKSYQSVPEEDDLDIFLEIEDNISILEDIVDHITDSIEMLESLTE